MRKIGFDSSETMTRFQEALIFADRLHAAQRRKGTNVPYIAHLLSVAALVMEAGGDEDERIAALLHDAVEDQGGQKTLKEIRVRFGDRVAGIVEGCTDSFTTPKPPWRDRKENYLAHLHDASPSVRRVSLADKLHNARTILRDLRLTGPEVWKRFRGGRDGSLWYYRQLADFYSTALPSPQAAELAEVVDAIETLAALNAEKSG
jgi:GTP pyrophosphokinase